MVFLTILKQAAKRVPMIKFRGPRGPASGYNLGKKSTPSKGRTAGVAPVKTAPKVDAKPAKGKAVAVSRRPTMEDWELPARYRRLTISEIEMDYINSGGPPLVKEKKPAPKKGAAKKGTAKKGTAKKGAPPKKPLKKTS